MADDDKRTNNATIAERRRAVEAARAERLALAVDPSLPREATPEEQARARKEWRQLLIENGAPAWAFGGELSRLTPEQEAEVKASVRSKRARKIPVHLGRAPTDMEEQEIREMEVEMNRARYMVGQTKGAEQKAWMRKRKELNERLITYERERGLWRPPLYSVSDVLTGKF